MRVEVKGTGMCCSPCAHTHLWLEFIDFSPWLHCSECVCVCVYKLTVFHSSKMNIFINPLHTSFFTQVGNCAVCHLVHTHTHAPAFNVYSRDIWSCSCKLNFDELHSIIAMERLRLRFKSLWSLRFEMFLKEFLKFFQTCMTLCLLWNKKQMFCCSFLC